jgi:hypothetical protein
VSVGRTFDITRAAKYLKVNPESIGVWYRSGKLIGQRDGLHQGRPLVFTQEALDKLREDMVK